jgi:cellobiose phosphorylase
MTRIGRGPYGHFDPDHREYVITRPDTPRPWFNYLMNRTYVAMISNTGGGVSYDTDPRVYRLLRYRYQNVPYDRPGRYVYLRDRDDGRTWSATWAPVHMPVKDCRYTCRVGTGYTVITLDYAGIRTAITYFVPPEGRQEIWDLTVTNVSRRTRRLQTFSYAEFAFWGAMRDLMNIDNCPNVSRQRHEDGAILHYSYNDIGSGLHGMHFVQNCGYHVSSERPYGFNGDRDRFLGRYRDERNPTVVETGRSTNYCENGGYPIGSLEHRFTLKPGQRKRIVYRTGISESDKAWRGDARRYDTLAKVDRAFAALKTGWDTRLSRFTVHTPDREFDALVNGFVQYQSAVTMRLSRSISSYEWGIGRSIGFRDSSQDQMGLTHAFPEVARDMLEKILGAIHENGEACHDFNPITGSFGAPGFYDDHNWPALPVNQYVKETGDLAFLDVVLPYAKSKARGTVYEHLQRCNDLAFRLRGKHGLMQIGAADWNDSLNPGDRRAESLFTSALYGASTLALLELAERKGDARYARTLRVRYAEVKRRMNGIGWDGAWYKRLIKRNGEVLGSRRTREYGRIFLEPQPWAVLAGFAAGARAVRTLDSVERRLGTPFGHRIMDRPFTRFDMEEIGSAGIFPPGIKENGSVFHHASSWMIAAEATLGRGDKAMAYFKRLCAVGKSRHAERHEVEPYVMCQFVSQPPFHIVGRGRNAWLTGSAAWMAIGALQHIVGCRADFDGLIVDPCIPAAWKRFALTRVFRGVTYQIEVRNPDGVMKGVRDVTVDGRRIRGNRIPWNPESRVVRVAVRMGSPIPNRPKEA